MELRVAGGRRLVGTVVDYRDTADRKVFIERIQPGALDISDVLLYAQHDRSQPLARTPATMQLRDSDTELSMIATLPQTQLADDVIKLVGAGVLQGLSIGFVCGRDRYEGQQRIVEDGVLDHVAVVDRPAYEESLVSVRHGRHGPNFRTFGWTSLDAPKVAPVRRRAWL